MRNESRDAIFKPLPSYEAGKDAIYAVPLVAERYGLRDGAGDRLTLQFIYQLFLRTSQHGVGEDVRRVWRRFVAELRVPDWVYRGVANLRNFAIATGAPTAVSRSLSLGVSPRNEVKLR